VKLLPRILLLALACTTVMVGAALAQKTVSNEGLKILSPDEGAYLAGPTRLRAQLDAAARVQSLVFFVDGSQVCALQKAPFQCEWDAGSSVDEHQVRVVATLIDGRRLVQTVRTKGLSYADRVNVDLVQVTATVSDRRGAYVRGLPRSAFHVLEDGRTQTITHFQSEDVPLELIVALDISGSMIPAMPKLKEVAKAFLNSVSSKDRVTVLGFNENVFTIARRAVDPDERVEGIDRLAAWGTTALYDVIIEAEDMLGRESGRKALIVFTDGEDEGSRSTVEDVRQRLQASDVTLYMIGQGRGTSLDRLKKVMRGLSDPTGGRALFTPNIDELHAAFAELLDELSNQYLLGYTPTNTAHDGVLRHIKLEVDGQHAVRAREAYRLMALPER